MQFDGARIGKDGVILAGAADKNVKFDAAMLLTVTRLACEADDPYFSLDPDDGRLWQREADQAFGEAWTALQADIKRAAGADAGRHRNSPQRRGAGRAAFADDVGAR
jgi:hypothetical protein